MPSSPNDSAPPGGRDFHTTRWSVVISAQGDTSGAESALAKLCTIYWYPLYAFVRRQGHGPHDAQDLTQEFFARLLAKGWLAGVARERGKFRSWLLASAKHFLAAVADAALDRSRLPLHARDFLQKLASAAFDRASFLAGNLRSLLARPAAITRRRRLASLALAPALALLIAIPIAVFLLLQLHRENAKWVARPELRKLALAVDDYNNIQGGMTLTFGGATKTALEWKAGQDAKYISGHFGEFVMSAEFDSDPVFGKWAGEQREAVREIVKAHPQVNPDELKLVDTAVEPTLASHLNGAPMVPFMIVPGMFASMLLLVCVSQFLSLLSFGSTLGQRLFGFAVVNSIGEPAGRCRLLWRWLIIWLPLFTATWLAFFRLDHGTGHWSHYFGFGKLVLWFACAVVAAVRPDRGIHDEIAGTRLVPR